MGELIRLNNITKKYSDTIALDKINLTFAKTGMIFIKGKSGCGKTTLLNILGGLDYPSDGDFYYDGDNTEKYTQHKWDTYRNCQVGLVFQEYNLLEDINVEKNIEIVLNIQDKSQDDDDKNNIISNSLQFVGMKGFEKRNINEMSGGQKQRIAIARAIAKHCKVILADEPTGNLDSENSRIVLEQLKKISESKLVIVVTHDVASAYEYGDRIITISDGRIVEDIRNNCNNNVTETCSVRVLDNEKQILGIVEERVEMLAAKFAEWVLNQKRSSKYTLEIEKTENSLSMSSHNLIKTDEANVKPRNLSFLYKLKLAKNNMSCKKVRLFLTTIMFALTIFLLMSVSFLATYDRKITISDYLESQNTNKYYLSKSEQYEDRFYDTKENTIRKGESFYNDITTLFQKAVLIPRIKLDSIYLQNSENDISITYDITVLSTDEPQILDIELEKGRFPTSENEILITDYVAYYQLKDDSILGKNVYLYDDMEFQVVGIIKTDCKEKQIAIKEKFNELNEFELADLNNKYNILIAGSILSNSLKERTKAINIPRSNFFISEMESHYIESSTKYGTCKLIKNKLLYGRMPKSPDEIVISSELAELEQIDKNSLGQKYSYLDICAEKYNNAYLDSINMHDFFKEDIKVVGIYDSGNEWQDNMPDIFIDDNVYSEILDLYYNYYWMEDYLIIINNNSYDEIIEKVDSNGYYINEPAVDKIYMFRGTLDSLRILIIIALATVALITLFVLSIYISNNIKVNSKKIGVLKAIGVTTRQISSIFLIEAVAINIIAFLIASVFTIIFIYMTNNNFVNQVDGHEIKYIYWEHKSALLLFVVTIILSMSSVLMPVLKLSKKKTVEIIRSIKID